MSEEKLYSLKELRDIVKTEEQKKNYRYEYNDAWNCMTEEDEFYWRISAPANISLIFGPHGYIPNKKLEYSYADLVRAFDAWIYFSKERPHLIDKLNTDQEKDLDQWIKDNPYLGVKTEKQLFDEYLEHCDAVFEAIQYDEDSVFNYADDCARAYNEDGIRVY